MALSECVCLCACGCLWDCAWLPIPLCSDKTYPDKPCDELGIALHQHLDLILYTVATQRHASVRCSIWVDVLASNGAQDGCLEALWGQKFVPCCCASEQCPALCALSAPAAGGHSAAPEA